MTDRTAFSGSGLMSVQDVLRVSPSRPSIVKQGGVVSTAGGRAPPAGGGSGLPLDSGRGVCPPEAVEAALSSLPIETGEDDLCAGISDGAAGDALAAQARSGELTLAYDDIKEAS